MAFDCAGVKAKTVSQGASRVQKRMQGDKLLKEQYLQITISEFEDALIAKAEIIEDYPKDKYGSSCLILGFTNVSRPLHILCSYPSRPLLKIITIYEPDPNIWINFKTRKK